MSRKPLHPELKAEILALHARGLSTRKIARELSKREHVARFGQSISHVAIWYAINGRQYESTSAIPRGRVKPADGRCERCRARATFSPCLICQPAA